MEQLQVRKQNLFISNNVVEIIQKWKGANNIWAGQCVCIKPVVTRQKNRRHFQVAVDLIMSPCVSSYCVSFCCACWPSTGVWPCHLVTVSVWTSPFAHTASRTTTVSWSTCQTASTSAALQPGPTCEYNYFFCLFEILGYLILYCWSLKM